MAALATLPNIAELTARHVWNLWEACVTRMQLRANIHWSCRWYSVTCLQ